MIFYIFGEGKGSYLKTCLDSLGLAALPFPLSHDLEPNIILQLFKKEVPVFATAFHGVLQMYLLLWLVFSHFMIKFQNREPLMPSPQFIKSYFSSFTDDIISQPMLKGEKSDEDKDKEGEALEVKEK